jgi:predicted ATP-grasp superfamily ATP-dependent carboligase
MTTEGDQMVRSLVRDLIAIPGVTVSLLRDEQLPALEDDTGHLHTLNVQHDENAKTRFLEAIDSVDAVWPIAPESEGCLADLCQIVEARRSPLLNTGSFGVALASSKQRTHDVLLAAGVPVVPTQSLSGRMTLPDHAFPAVFKIDDGAGCENTIIVTEPRDAGSFLENPPHGDWLIQPLLTGEPLSLSGLFFHGEARLLSVNRQHITQTQDGFHLSGITVQDKTDESGTFSGLLSAIAQGLPALWGFAGVDLLWENTGPKVLEINPRLTSAYAGIRCATGLNPAALVLEMHQMKRLPHFAPSIHTSHFLDLKL